MEFKMFAKFVITTMCIIFCFACSEKVNKENGDTKPNVLFISIDDLNDWIEPLGGNDQAKTPHISEFSKSAVNFNYAYCASPGCNPSRGAILTGLNTYTSGLYSNYQDWRKIPLMTDNPTLNGYFKENGYYTAGAGKIYHYTQTDTMGWDNYFPSKTNPMPQEHLPENRPLNMPRYKNMYGMFDWGPIDIKDEKTADFQSVSFIKEQLGKEHEKPFFLACGIYRPHVPWYVPQKYFDLFPIEDIRLPQLMEKDLEDLGSFAKDELAIRGGNYHKHVVQANQWKNAIQGYLASIAFADEMFGELMEALSESKYAENTIIVLWSDHGWQLGEKEHWRKFALWENVNRSVLMLKTPKIDDLLPEGSTTGKVNSLVSLVDIYPTLVDLCGLPERKDLDGKSLLPFLQDPTLMLERPVITTYDYGSYSVRYQNWHLIKYIDESTELYNLESDPHEWDNLANNTKFEKERIELEGFIPSEPADFPESSLIELQEHHIPPIQSKAHFESKERQEWIARFRVN